MKTILIPTEDHDAMPAVLEAGLTLARVFDSYIEGFAMWALRAASPSKAPEMARLETGSTVT